MSNRNIHPSAIIEPGAEIGDNVTVEAYAIIKSNVKLHDNVVVKSHVYIDGNTTVGEGTTIYPFASIGTKTQDLKHRGETTYVNIGKHCQIREYATINSSSGEGSIVKVGDHCLIMAYCHIAHNSELEDHVIMSNNATLAGHVKVERYAIIGGMTPVHQFVRIGRFAMVGGMSRVLGDVPPYTLGSGILPYKFGGLNLVGLKRHGFLPEVRAHLSRAFKLLYRSGLKAEEALNRIEQEIPMIDEVKHFVNFCRNSKRGLIGMQGITNPATDELEFYEEECQVQFN